MAQGGCWEIKKGFLCLTRILKIDTNRQPPFFSDSEFLYMLMQIFLPCGHSSPDVPLRLVDVQHNAGLSGQRWIDVQQPLRNVFMRRYC